MDYSKKAVHFGGGNIGRGFVAEFLHKSGYEVIFVDVADALIESLQKTKSYTVTEIGAEGEHTFTIDHYRALNSKHSLDEVIKEISEADVVTCAVGPNVMKFIADPIAKGIDARKSSTPLAVIACENMIGGTDKLKTFIDAKLQTSQEELPKKARFANSAIDRIVPGQDPDAGLNVKIEKFYEWCVDQSRFDKGAAPKIEGVHFVDDLTPYIERKLFTVNTSHATAAYYGHNRGKHTIHEAMADNDICAIVREAIEETSHLICYKHKVDKIEQKEYREKIVTRISNPHLEDVVERVGRAPIRKLGRNERFIGPAAELAENGDKVDALLGAVEMCLSFQDVEGDEESAELAKILKEKDAKAATEHLTGLTEKDKLYERVVKIVEKVQKSKS